MNSTQTFFCRFYFLRSFPAFIIQFLKYLTHNPGRKTLVQMQSQKCLCQEDWYLGGVWMLASVCVFCTKIFIPQFPLYMLVHHLKVQDRNGHGQLERSVVSFGVTFVLLYSCGFFLLCSLSFTLHVLWLWSTCSLWLSHKNAFVSLQAVRFL